METMKVSKENKVEDDKWKAEDDLRILISAEAIKKDDKKMAAVKKLAKEKMADMKKIGGQEVKEDTGEKDEIEETVGR